MLSVDHRLYVRVVEQPQGPQPLPLSSGFNSDTAYRALGLFRPSETGEAYVVCSNDHDEILFVASGHLRAVGLIDGGLALRLPLNRAAALVASGERAAHPAAAGAVDL